MPVFQKDNKKILFVHIPKAGGTSIEHLFKKNGWNMTFFDGGGQYSVNSFMKCSPQHIHYEIINKIFRLESFDYIFSFTRDPIDRLKSEYKWRKKYLNETSNFNDWFEFTFSQFYNNPFIHDNHIRPQDDFLGPNVNHFKIEDGINDGFKKFIHEIDPNFDLSVIPNVMRSSEKIALDLTEQQLSRVKTFYKNDFEKLKY